MDREGEESEDRKAPEEPAEEPSEGPASDQASEQSSEERDDDKQRDDDDSPGPKEPTEEEERQQREEDARQARERMNEVMDAPPEEHGALKADALGSTIILVGALFIILGVIVTLAYSPWGLAGVAIGIGEVIVGQLIRSGKLSRAGGR